MRPPCEVGVGSRPGAGLGVGQPPPAEARGKGVTRRATLTGTYHVRIRGLRGLGACSLSVFNPQQVGAERLGCPTQGRGGSDEPVGVPAVPGHSHRDAPERRRGGGGLGFSIKSPRGKLSHLPRRVSGT